MGLHFLELAEGSKELIYRIVDQHIALGGTPFDLTQRPPDPVPRGAGGPAARPAAAAFRRDALAPAGAAAAARSPPPPRDRRGTSSICRR